MEAILRDSFKPEESLSLLELLEADRDNQIQAQRLSDLCGENIDTCTYTDINGYIDQPVFACLTCSKHDLNVAVENLDITKLAGFCLGCSMNCHLDHRVIELWTKRKFKCDCGNSKFSGSTQPECLLSCKKDAINPLNRYNHNFIGKYCYCHREYSAAEEAMHQCLLCQDWFHETCIVLHHLRVNPDLKLKYDQEYRYSNTMHKAIQHNHNDNVHSTTNTSNNNTDEDGEEIFFDHFKKYLIPPNGEESNSPNADAFVCKHCALQYSSFLLPHRVNLEQKENQSNHATMSSNHNDDDDDGPLSVRRNKRIFSAMNNDSSNPSNSGHEDRKKKRRIMTESDDVADCTNSNSHCNQNGNDTFHDEAEEQKKEDTLPCTRESMDTEMGKDLKSLIGGGIWMQSGWVDRLCQCKECWSKIYAKEQVEWLFESREESKEGTMDIMAKSQEEPSSRRLSSEYSTDDMVASSIAKLPRQQALDALNVVVKGTDLIKQRLRDFLSKSPPKKVITPDDIHEMFKPSTKKM